jgi:hypothetical protein
MYDHHFDRNSFSTRQFRCQTEPPSPAPSYHFHGDNGAGIGASHQTGWTGCIARIIQANGAFTGEMLSERHIEKLAIKMGQSISGE